MFYENGKFVFNVYRKETLNGVYTNFSNFISLEHKFGLIYTLFHRCFYLVSDMSKFYFEIDELKYFFFHLNDIPINSLKNVFLNLVIICILRNLSC